MDIKPGSTEDLLQGAALLSALSAVITIGISGLLTRVVALKSLPDQRALWTVTPGIVIAFCLCGAMVIGLGMPFYTIFVTVLPGLLVFWWYRGQYRKAWIPDDQIPDDVTLENDDWTVGLAGIAILLLIGLYRVVWKTLVGN